MAIPYYRDMSDAMLNAAKVRQLVDSKGLRLDWIIREVGLKRTSGYMMLREGLLPKDPEVRNRSLEKLAQILGVEVPQILLRLERPRRKTA